MHANLQTLAAQHGWPVGFGLGVAVFVSPPPDFQDALRRADGLMYRAKGMGKNHLLLSEYPEPAKDTGVPTPPT
jgi:PleD family two-component response regulator